MAPWVLGAASGSKATARKCQDPSATDRSLPVVTVEGEPLNPAIKLPPSVQIERLPVPLANSSQLDTDVGTRTQPPTVKPALACVALACPVKLIGRLPN